MKPDSQLEYHVSFAASYFKRDVDNLVQTQWRPTKVGKAVPESGRRED